MKILLVHANTIDDDTLTWILFHHSYQTAVVLSGQIDPFVTGHLSIGDKCQLYTKTTTALSHDVKIIDCGLVHHMYIFHVLPKFSSC